MFYHITGAGDRRTLLMKFCTKCGRPLQDGEVCNCQTENAQPQAENVQDENAQPQTEQQAPEAATAAAQPAAKPIITKEQATEISKGMLAFAKEFVKNPVEASGAVVGEHSLATVAGLVVVNAAAELVYKIIRMIVWTAKYGSYGIADWLKAIFCTVLWWIAIPAALAGLIWVCGKFVQKQEVNFKTALSVFAIPALPLLVFTVVKLLQLVLTHSFFGVIFSVITTAIGGMMLYLTGIGIVKILPRENKNFVYSVGIICAGLWFVNWLVTIAIF